jgi:hypothetical protein
LIRDDLIWERGHWAVDDIHSAIEPNPWSLRGIAVVALALCFGPGAMAYAANLLALAQQIGEHRLLSIGGTRGPGKTTVAIALAGRVKSAYQDGVAYNNLAPITDLGFRRTLLASKLGLSIRPERSPAFLGPTHGR